VKIRGGSNKLGIVSNGCACIIVDLLILNLCAMLGWVVKTKIMRFFNVSHNLKLVKLYWGMVYILGIILVIYFITGGVPPIFRNPESYVTQNNNNSSCFQLA